MEKNAVITTPKDVQDALVSLYENFENLPLEGQASSMLDGFNKIMREELSVRELAFYIMQAKSEQLQRSKGYKASEFFAVFIINKLVPATSFFDTSR